MSGRHASRVVVVGAGGIGCALGHALCADGLEVAFVEADPEKIDWGRRHGVGLDGHPPLPAEFLHFDEWVPHPRDTTILCTKCYDNEAVLARLEADAEILAVQNGFDRGLIERAPIEGVASFVSECAPHRTQTRITRPGALHVGVEPAHGARRPSESALRVLDAFERRGAFELVRVADALPFKYSKLMYNAAISPLAAMAGLDNGGLLTNRAARKPFFTLLRENYGILKTAGVALGRIGPFHPDSVDRILRWPFVARVMAGSFARTLRRTYCSMSGDIEKGRTEIDHYNGHLIEIAGGRACGLNRIVHALVTRMTRERLAPGIHWLDHLAA